MIWFFGWGVCICIYGMEAIRYFMARRGSVEQAEWIRPGDRWLAGKYSSLRNWQFAQLHWLMQSQDEIVETSRTGSIASLVFALVWLVVGVPIGGFLDTAVSWSAALSPVLGAAAIVGSLIAIGSTSRLAIAAVASNADRRFIVPIRGILVGATIVFVCVLATSMRSA